MKPHTQPAPLRARRKQDLLLASRLARRQALVAFAEVGEAADGIGRQLLGLRDTLRWITSAPVWAAGGGAALLAGMLLRRRWPARAELLRWGLWAWRLWLHRHSRRVLHQDAEPGH